MLRQAQFLTLILSLGFFLVFHSDLLAQKKAKPFFKDGEAQVVPAFDNPDEWIRHDLWVETEFDTDGDNKPDRMHVSVTRPAQTENKKLKLPVIYNTSPYFAGTAGNDEDIFWNVEH
ncbi:MAG: Xaa-Pro dipeptidyl-peptidase, partial [Bacteroidetes bacterium]|nr:Xaa-Pro dipeptidyl-peptidase [Bacteroidota bacterium]